MYLQFSFNRARPWIDHTQKQDVFLQDRLPRLLQPVASSAEVQAQLPQQLRGFMSWWHVGISCAVPALSLQKDEVFSSI